IWPLTIILFLLATLAVAVHTIFLKPGISPTSNNLTRKEPLTSTPQHQKNHQIGKLKPQNNKKAIKHQPEPENRLAIIIDDMGEDFKIGSALIDLNLPLSFSFLPFASHNENLLQAAAQQKRDILLHLPMEPENGDWDPGRGALYTAMSPARIKMTIAANLAEVPSAIGVNNHMGSGFTADRRSMSTCLSFLKQRDLFFIDSLTSNRSLGFSLARNKGLKTAKRDIFLDNKKNVEEIKKNISSLIEIARKHGQSIGIGHPYPETLEALRQSREALRQNVKVVGIHDLVE
ncbi:MAG: divergent polysaccharide deacetylase family protein, partial [Desulfobia sp.]